ncbi:MAG TPA: hypothetical protein VF221_14050 [Chloroflexota bacterium]
MKDVTVPQMASEVPAAVEVELVDVLVEVVLVVVDEAVPDPPVCAEAGSTGLPRNRSARSRGTIKRSAEGKSF